MLRLRRWWKSAVQRLRPPRLFAHGCQQPLGHHYWKGQPFSTPQIVRLWCWVAMVTRGAHQNRRPAHSHTHIPTNHLFPKAKIGTRSRRIARASPGCASRRAPSITPRLFVAESAVRAVYFRPACPLAGANEELSCFYSIYLCEIYI